MSRIHQLPTSVITKIAAGEVIERPASVVKELLENSVDAGCTRIDIEIEEGGSELIRVVDDGSGIAAEDLPLAFANHATSKLNRAEDLFCVQSMGFRGEALASIGGVGQVLLQSRPHDQLAGAEIACHGGVLSPIKVWNGAPGTRMEVRHLFFNTPVRRKFLKSPGTEMGHICEIFTRLALAQPGLHLTLKHNDKMVYEVPGSAGLRERLQLFFGPEVSEHLLALDSRQGPVRLYGYVADPACDRGQARLQYLFLNGRWIRDRSLGHALQESYRGLLMVGRYAVAFLFLEMPPDHVDVNVHPTKAEVRFRDGQGLYGFVLHTIRSRLNEANLTPRFKLNSGPANSAASGAFVPWMAPQVQVQTPSLFSQPGLPSYTKVSSPPVPPPKQDETFSGKDTASPPSEASNDLPTSECNVPAPQPDTTPWTAEKALQLYNAYLVLETQEGMLVIDQHALHERILFEQLKDRLRQGTLEIQRLLIPEPVELTSDQASRVLDQRQALGELGLGVEDFGGGTVLLTSYPAILSRRPPAEILKAVVDHLTSKDRLPTREQLLNHLLSLMACHAAVRAGDPLTQEEIAALLAQRDLARDVHHCPHGRPTALLLSRQELERQFGRV